MPRITKLQFDPLSVQSQADRQHVRSGGLHLSDIYQDINDTIGKSKRKSELSQEELDAYRAQGFIWEHVLGDAMAVCLGSDTWVRPGEIQVDGITGSPDLFDTADMSIVETKATYKSFRKMGDQASGLRDEFWIWGVQMQGYCHMIGTRTSKLYALFVNGDYSKYQPMFRAWQFEWSGQELKENWMMLIGHAKRKGWLK